MYLKPLKVDDAGRITIVQKHGQEYCIVILAEGAKIFKCTQCDHKCKSKNDLYKHILCMHIKIKSFECLKCSSAFYNEWKLKEHITSKHEVPFACKYCKERFAITPRQCVSTKNVID